ncbi:hypothetical protein D3C86_1990220 [compost metagenome]
MKDVALGAVGLQHHAVVGRRNVDDGLGGFHRDQQLVGLDAVAGLDVPFDDFRLLQAFAEVGQLEVFHGYCSPFQGACCAPAAQAYSSTASQAARMSPTSGR